MRFDHKSVVMFVIDQMGGGFVLRCLAEHFEELGTNHSKRLAYDLHRLADTISGA